ncbi:MAG: acyl-CoA dehydrogenase family protein [Planctomycetota bacterium]
MLLDLTDSQRQLRDTAREFADKILIPSADRYDRLEEFPEENIKKLADLGFMGILIPEEYGGGGHDNVTLAVAFEEIHRGCASTGVTLSVHSSLLSSPILNFGTEATKQKYLPQLATGESLGAYAITEPNFGSDAAHIETSCVLKGDKYIVNGTKAWITNGGYADVFVIFASLDPGAGANSMCAFVVEKSFPGLKVGKKEEKLGIRASDTVQLVFEDLEVPVENRLGEEGQGFKVAMHTLDGGRIGIATQSVGIARACLDASTKHANERVQFGKLLRKSQTVQFKIADMATEIDAARLLTLRAARLKDQGQPHTKAASMAKLFASETANRAAREAIQIHGGPGVCRGLPVERFFRDAKITEIYEGTSEVQRLVISRHALEEGSAP